MVIRDLDLERLLEANDQLEKGVRTEYARCAHLERLGLHGTRFDTDCGADRISDLPFDLGSFPAGLLLVDQQVVNSCPRRQGYRVDGASFGSELLGADDGREASGPKEHP